jgi:signal transduction histidine kinase
LLEVTNPFHDDLRLYTQAPNGGFIERRAGDRLDRQLLEVDYRQAVFRLDLETEAPQTLWLRLQSVNSVSAQVLVWQPEAFHQAVRTETLSYGLFFGVYLTILIFHLFFWRWTREPVGGWYVLYVASNGMITLLAVGYFQQYSGWSGSVTDAMIGILTCSAIWITTMFAVMQVDLGSVMPRTRRALVYGSAALSAPFAALTLGVSYPAGVVPAQLVSMGWGLMMLALPLWLWWRGHAPARFFALAFGVFIAGSVLHYLRTLGLVQPNLLTDYGYQIGSVIHMLMMSLAITGHYSAKKAQRLEAQMTANASLETQVVQRTKLLSTEVDQRRKLEFELRQALAVEQQARQQQRDFVAMVSHEFRTPLAIISSSVHHVARNLDASQEKSLERCGNIKESVSRMTDLMDNYLAFDRVEENSDVLRLAPCDIGEMAGGLITEWPAGRVQLSKAALPPTLLCDWKLVRVALQNLINNGLRHSPAGAALHISLNGEADGSVCVEVRDSGSGIPSDEIAHVFQKYYRGRGAVGKPGAGLGLYIVQRIAQLHGGTVVAHSEPGKGSSFVLTLPGRHVFARRSTDYVGIQGGRESIIQ